MYEIYEKLINAKGISSYLVSKETGVSQVIISNWKNGISHPKIDKLEKIAEYLGVTVDYLSGREPREKTKKKKGTIIPVLGIVPCGIPLEAIEDVRDTEEISEELAKTGTFFGLEAIGDSMYPRIMEGDVMIIKQTPSVDTGSIAIVKVNGDESTCKKISFSENGMTLIPLNPQYEPKFYTKEDIEKLPITIVGQVIEVRGKL